MTTKNHTAFLPYLFAKKHGALVSEVTDVANVLYVKGTPLQVFAEIKRILQCPLKLNEISVTQFQEYLGQIYQSNSSLLDATLGMEEELNLEQFASQLPASEDLLNNQDDAPIIRLINVLFTDAIKKKASDIHIETYENKVLVRNRIDGILHEVLEIQRSIAPLVISRVKVMAKLDIAEKRIPQDGRITLHIADHNIDVRVSTLPSNHGERLVLRILDKKTAKLDLSILGMNTPTLNKVKKLINEPHGILLVTGPTGSGKTTSLYAMLTSLNEVTRNILTIEDPIEYDLPGIGQTQVNKKIQMTFAKGLRAILRQDPDVVMIGEIRDLETAEIAVQASLTGHLVLSTLHTNTALGAITRLKDMGIESFLLSTSIIGLIAQRLVRRLCEHCKIPHHIKQDECELMKLDDSSIILYEPNGCEKCNNVGYNGRMGIYEVITIDENLQSMIHRNEEIKTIEKYIRPNMPSIREDGFKRVLEGQTTLAEILRVTSS